MLRLEPRDVVVADVPAILAQMRGDAVGAGRDRDLARPYGIGMAAAARVAHGRDMIDVDAEADGGSAGTGISDRMTRCATAAVAPLSRIHRSALRHDVFARSCEMIEVRCLRS